MPARILSGVVVSAATNKTVIVNVDRFILHPIYKKRIKKSKRYPAHDETGKQVGAKVQIIECRPISKTKKWKVID